MLIVRDITKVSEDRANLALVNKFRIKLNDLNSIKDITLKQLLQMQETTSSMKDEIEELHDDLIDDLNDVKYDLSVRGVSGKDDVINTIQELLDEAEAELEDISKDIDLTITCLNLCQTCNTSCNTTGQTCNAQVGEASCGESQICLVEGESVPCTSEVQNTLTCIYNGDNSLDCTDQNQGTNVETKVCPACHGSTVTTETTTETICSQCNEDNCIGGSCDALVRCDSSLGGEDQPEIDISPDCRSAKYSYSCDVLHGHSLCTAIRDDIVCKQYLKKICDADVYNNCDPNITYTCASNKDESVHMDDVSCWPTISVSYEDNVVHYDHGPLHYDCKSLTDFSGFCRPTISVNSACNETYVTNDWCATTGDMVNSNCNSPSISRISCGGKVNVTYCNGEVQKAGCDILIKCDGQVQTTYYECGTGQQNEHQEITNTIETPVCTAGATTGQSTYEEIVHTGCTSATIAQQEVIKACIDLGDSYVEILDACGVPFSSCTNTGGCDYARYGSVVGCDTTQGCGTCNGGTNTCNGGQSCTTGQTCTTCNITNCGTCQSTSQCSGGCNSSCTSSCNGGCQTDQCSSACLKQCQDPAEKCTGCYGSCDTIINQWCTSTCMKSCQQTL